MLILIATAGCEKVNPRSEKEQMVAFFEGLRGKVADVESYFPDIPGGQVLSLTPSRRYVVSFSRDITYGDTDETFVIQTPRPSGFPNPGRLERLENIPGKLRILSFVVGGVLSYNHRSNIHLDPFKPTFNEQRVTENDIGTVDFSDVSKGKIEIISSTEFKITGRTYKSNPQTITEPRMYIFKIRN
jgi:hypothetical protein